MKNPFSQSIPWLISSLKSIVTLRGTNQGWRNDRQRIDNGLDVLVSKGKVVLLNVV